MRLCSTSSVFSVGVGADDYYLGNFNKMRRKGRPKRQKQGKSEYGSGSGVLGGGRGSRRGRRGENKAK